jgi:hypothetical protein
LEQTCRSGRRLWRLQDFLQPGHVAARWRRLMYGSGPRPPQTHADGGRRHPRYEFAAVS